MSEDADTRAAEAASVEMRELVVDGVRVMHFPDESGRTSATLIFGVGLRDETLPTIGTLHALEHAVMTGVRRTPIEINGSVETSTTQFTASGSSDHVSAYLTGVCHGLADPPTDRLAHEASILEAEAEGGGSGTSPAAVARYGFRGLGIVGGPGPSPRRVVEDVVRAVAAAWFVASNALLIIEGTLPKDLRLPLVVGDRPEHLRGPIRHVIEPSVITVDGPACELNLVMPAEPVALTRLATTVLDERLTEVLRHELGLVYLLDVHPIAVPGGYDVTVRTDPTPGRVAECVRAMVDVTRTLMDEGPSGTEVEHARAVIRESLRGRDGEIGYLVERAMAELIGLPVLPIDLDALAGYSRDQVTEHLKMIANDLIYVVDEAVEPEVASLRLSLIEPGPTSTGPLPPGEVFRPPLMALAFAKQARASRVVLSSSGLTHAYDGRLHHLDWPEVVGVMRDEDGDVVAFGQNGQAILVGPNMYKGGQRLIDALLSHVPRHLVYDAPPDLDRDDAASIRT